MGTRNVAINSESYTLITSAEDFFYQNTAKESTQFVFADTQPDNSLIPHEMHSKEAFQRNGIPGSLYGKRFPGLPGEVKVTVSD